MRKFESNVQYIKYQVNKEIAKRFLNGEKMNDATVQKITETIAPGPKALTRCCIYKERHILSERVNINIKAVKKGETLLILEAMKMQNEIAAPHDAVVAEVRVAANQTVSTGDDMVVLG